MKTRCFLILLLIGPVFAEKITSAQLKSGIIFKFAENINWPEESKGHYFSIGYYGKDKRTFAALSSNALDWTIGGKKVAVRKIDRLEDLEGLNLLYVEKNMAYQGEKLLRVTQSKGILLITEACKDEQYIMLNISYSPKKKQYTYRFNRKNIISAGLQIKLDLVLHGGTEADLKEWFQSVQDSLAGQRKLVLHQVEIQKELEYKNDSAMLQLQKNQARIEAQKRELETQAKLLKAQQQKLDRLLLKIKKRQSKIVEKSKTLSKPAAKSESIKRKPPIKQNAADRHTGGLRRLQQEVGQDQKLLITELRQLKQEIEQNRNLLEAEKGRLAEEPVHGILPLSQMEIQKIILVLSMGLFVVVLFLIWATYRANRAKKAIAEKMEQMVREKILKLAELNQTPDKGIQEHIRIQTERARLDKLLK